MAVAAEVPHMIEEFPSKAAEPHFTDANLQRIIDEATRPQSASIITLGSGNSSLASTIVGQRMEHYTTTKANISRIQVGNEVSVNIIDTCSTGKGRQTDEDIVQLVGAIVAKEPKGVAIICIDMYNQLDEHTLETLVLLHKRFGDKFWSHVVIALTNAECYNEHEWLKSKWFFECTQSFLRTKFAEKVEEWRNNLRNSFTATSDRFDRIPVIPTSQLYRDGLD